MSYCRWSSDNWKSDLYCFEDVNGGYTTYVACRRIVGDVPELPSIRDVSSEEFLKAYRVQMDWLETAEYEPIGLPHDEESFNDPDLESFLERLLYLREVRYNFPDYVVETVKEEIKSK